MLSKSRRGRESHDPMRSPCINPRSIGAPRVISIMSDFLQARLEPWTRRCRSDMRMEGCQPLHTVTEQSTGNEYPLHRMEKEDPVWRETASYNVILYNVMIPWALYIVLDRIVHPSACKRCVVASYAAIDTSVIDAILSRDIG